MNAPDISADPASSGYVNNLRGPVVPLNERAKHLSAVSLCQATGLPRSAARVAAISERLDSQTHSRLFERAFAATTVSQRVYWLPRGADVVEQAAVGDVACRRGCAHCCHIPVLVSEAEARSSGRDIGRSPRRASELTLSTQLPKVGVADDDPLMRGLLALQGELTQRYVGVPCSFLSTSNDCKIFAERPLACRRLLNVDDDDLMCRLVRGVEHGPPYLDVRREQGLELLCLSSGRTVADLRDWFPAITTDPPKGEGGA